MAEQITLDREQLTQIHEVMARLQKTGMKRAKYNIASPLARHRVTVKDDESTDPRIIHLSRPK